MAGLPATYLRDEDARDGMRQQRAQQQEVENKLQVAAGAAKAAGDMAPAVQAMQGMGQNGMGGGGGDPMAMLEQLMGGRAARGRGREPADAGPADARSPARRLPGQLKYPYAVARPAEPWTCRHVPGGTAPRAAATRPEARRKPR